MLLGRHSGTVESGVIIGAWLGSPCTTWSRALREPLRSISIQVITACVRLGILVYLENPSAPVMWHAPSFGLFCFVLTVTLMFLICAGLGLPGGSVQG